MSKTFRSTLKQEAAGLAAQGQQVNKHLPRYEVVQSVLGRISELAAEARNSAERRCIRRTGQRSVESVMGRYRP